MQAAIIAKKMGHTVRLAEKQDSLGGQMFIAGVPPFKTAIHDAMNWFIGEVERLGIDVDLNAEVDMDYVERFNPDAVLLAVGSQPSRPPVEGIGLCEDGWDVLRNSEDLPENQEVIIIGGGTVGCEIAHTLIEKNDHVTIIEMDDGLSKKQNNVHRQRNEQILKDAD